MDSSKSICIRSGCCFWWGNISTEYSFDVRYTLKDTFSSISIQEIISTAAVVMDFKRGGKGVAVGKVAEDEYVFEVSEDWDVRVYGKLLKDYIQQFAKTIYPVGSIYMSVVNTNPSQFLEELGWRGEQEESL